MSGEKKKPTESAAKANPRRPASKPKMDWQPFVEEMEKSLLELKSGIIETLIAGNKDFKEIVEGMDPKDFADIASDDVDRKMIEVIGSQELKQLKLIESALTRISQGKYGYCIKCEKRIPQDRLEAIPYALMCVGCKSEEERRNR
jgi:RNA polymerase-binding transcription factor DksA